jgi:hypothetical protein
VQKARGGIVNRLGVPPVSFPQDRESPRLLFFVPFVPAGMARGADALARQRCLKPAQDRGPELRYKCPILALDPLAEFDDLN